MRPKTLIVLGSLAVIAIGLVVLDTYWTRRRERQEEAAKKVLAALPWEKITRLEIQTEKEKSPIVLQRTSSGSPSAWQILQPIREEADGSAVDRLWNGLKDLTYERKFEMATGTKLADFGLDPPRSLIRLQDAEGHTLATLKVGRKTPVEGDLYAMLEGSRDVLILPSWRESTLVPALKDLRNRRLTNLKATDLAHIVVERKGLEPPTLAFRKDRGLWRIEQPRPLLASASTLAALTSTLEFLEAEDFVAEQATDWTPYGLDDPEVRLTVETAQGAQQIFLFGKSRDESTYFARVGAQSRVVAVRKSIVEDLKRGLDYWRSSQAIDFDYYNLQSARLREGTRTWELVKETQAGETWKEQWFLKAGTQKKEVPFNIVEDFFRNLDYAEADHIRDDVPDTELAALGLQTPALVVQVTDKDRPTQTVEIGRVGDKTYTRNPDFPRTVFELKKESADKLWQAWQELKQKMEGQEGKKTKG